MHMYLNTHEDFESLTITRLKKIFNFNMLYIFSDVIIGLPGDDDNIEIDENDHEECM